MNTITIDRREQATILAALRYWQAVGFPPRRFVTIATDGDQVNPLTDDEIDSLCEKVNA